MIGSVIGPQEMVIIALLIFIPWIWKLGKLLGTRLSQTAGLIVGIILITSGFAFFAGISCIIYSQKNEDKSLELDFKLNSDANSNINRPSNADNDTKECPYCAETIKLNAKICRFCNRDVT